MIAPSPSPTGDRWRDADGAHIALFCWVEQVMEDTDPGVLPSRLHQRGQVVGRGLASVYVWFVDNALVSLPSPLLRRLCGGTGECPGTSCTSGCSNSH